MGWISWRRLLLLRGRSGESVREASFVLSALVFGFTCIMFWRVFSMVMNWLGVLKMYKRC